MSKERQRRRADREREQAMQTAARAAEAERRERRAARKRAMTSKLPGLETLASARSSTTGKNRQSGALAQRRRQEVTITACILAAFNIVVWISRSEWASRTGALVVTLLVAPVVHILLHRRS